MKQIIFFHPSSDLYGSDKILAYIIKCYSTYKITVILKKQGPLIEYLTSIFPNIDIIIISSLPVIAKKNLKPTGILAFLYSLTKFRHNLKAMRLQDNCIIYLNTLATIPVIFCLPNRKRVKVITHVHEILKNNNLLHKIINRTTLKYSNYIFCVSKAVKNNLLDITLPKEQQKLIVIQNGISFNNTLQKQSPTNTQINQRLIKFALIGRIKPLNKGQNFLSEAISLLPNHLKEKAHFYYIGSTVDGQEYMLTEVKNRIKELDINSYIDILPFTSDIGKIYQDIDVSIVPSLCEDSFPTTILESMYWGKPVIGTNVGGIPEMILNNITGYIIDKESPQELANKISYFIENPDAITKMGDEGQKVFNKNFTEECFKLRYIETLKKLSIF